MAKKQCTGCGLSVGVRTKECPECGNKFVIRKRGPRPKEVANWLELKSGDIIKVVTGTGPYFLSKDKPGEKIMMGHKGKFEVVELNNLNPKSRGIIGRQINNGGYRSNVVEYIYMGDSYYDESLSTHKEPHKILGVQTEAAVIVNPKKKKKRRKKVDSVTSLNKLIEEL